DCRSEPMSVKQNREGSRSPWADWLLISALTTAAWAVLEPAIGLTFLAFGVRPWECYATPVLWATTSPLCWVLVFLIAGPHLFAYRIWERRAGVRGRRRWLYRAAFSAVVGPVGEVVWGGLIAALVGRPLSLYTLWPTFGGLGSALPPLYYL